MSQCFLTFTDHATGKLKDVYGDGKLEHVLAQPIGTDADGFLPAIFLEGDDPANTYDLTISDERYRTLIEFKPLHSPCVPRWLCLWAPWTPLRTRT
jgi:hypothetical protein